MSVGRRRAQKAAGTGAGRRALLHVLGVLAGGAAWVFLVRAAIDFGRSARVHGSAAGWGFTVVAGVGAACCLMVVFVLLTRLGTALGSRSRHAPGRHR